MIYYLKNMVFNKPPGESVIVDTLLKDYEIYINDSTTDEIKIEKK